MVQRPQSLQALGGQRRIHDFAELVQLGYAGNINIKSNDEAFSLIKADRFVQTYRFQRVVMGVRAINEQKAKGGR